MAEKLNVSRQTISRWEGATAQPDAANILQLSKLFGVTTDYLLNDEYDYEEDIPIVKYATDQATNRSVMEMSCILSICLSIISVVIGATGLFISKSTIMTVISIILSIITVACFEASLVKYGKNDKKVYRSRFYDISVWLLSFIPACIVTGFSDFLVWSLLNKIFSYSAFHSVLSLIINLIYFIAIYLLMVFVSKYFIRKR